MNGISARLAAASGAFYVVAILVGNHMALSGSADVTDGAGALAYVQRDPSLVNTAGLMLEILGFAAFLVFLGYLYRVLRHAEGPDGWAAAVGLGGGLLGLAIKLGSIAPLIVGTYRQDVLTPDLARTMIDLNDAAFVVFGLTFGLFGVAAAGSSIAHRVLPVWLGWFGAVAGVLAVAAGLVGVLDPNNYNPLAFLAVTLWVLVVSVLLTVRATRSAGEPTPSESTAGRADLAGAV